MRKLAQLRRHFSPPLHPHPLCILPLRAPYPSPITPHLLCPPPTWEQKSAMTVAELSEGLDLISLK